MTLIVKPVTNDALAECMGQFLGDNRISDFVQNEERQETQETQWSDFLAKAVHDFRAPLTAATGYCELLLGQELGPLTEHQKEILNRTQNSLARLARMTSDVLSRAAGIQKSGRQAKGPHAASGKASGNDVAGVSMLNPLLEEGEIEALVEQAIDEVQLTATRKDIRIAGNLRPCGGPMYFDSPQLQQVLANLLENACKFTAVGGRIEISGYPYGTKFFRVDVFNTGPAISPGRLAKIFDDYASFGIDGTSEGGAGTGLGLAISKRIIEQHKGRIWIENQAEGTCVSFTLPLERSQVSRAG
ncbi:MAG: HAMP domain-containing histidine kinase [Bryobacterales bacterium]|nr:HAMP domain-containing histidine kinase [Bryobacterales bacterium]